MSDKIFDPTGELPTIRAKGKFFVTSNGDSPEVIKFTLEDALLEGDTYIDVFGEDGQKVGSLCAAHEATYVDGVDPALVEWTTSF